MKARPNLKVAVVIALIHFFIGLGSALMGASESMTPQGGGNGWITLAYIFTFPLGTIFELVHHREGFGFGGNVLLMAAQSYGWGLLLSLLYPPRSSNE